MPVTIKPSEHAATLKNTKGGQGLLTKEDILREVTKKNGRRSTKPVEVLQSSISVAQNEEHHHLQVTSHGFLSACIEAYSNHQHLIIKPDDIWLAILTQFNAYVNAHGEELRDKFVTHDGQKDLVLIYDAADRYSFDFSIFANDVSKLLENDVKDPSLRKWIIPNFTTTSDTDVTVACIAMMSTLQTYYRYTVVLRCGIPSVTLLGERSDYEAILQRLDRLADFGKEPAQFAALLRPVISRLISGFDDPASPETIRFWQQIYTREPQRSGSPIFSGWITAFCFWNDKGKCLYQLPAETSSSKGGLPSKYLTLDGVVYHHVSSDQSPHGWCRVPVKLIDNGKEFAAHMLAGSVAMTFSSSGQKRGGKKGEVGLDTVSPKAGWFMFVGDI